MVSTLTSSGYKGVYPKRNGNSIRWAAVISSGGKKIHLGNFATPELAAIAYDEAAKEPVPQPGSCKHGRLGLCTKCRAERGWSEWKLYRKWMI